MANFIPGQRVKYRTNFYTEPVNQEGEGVVERVEACQDGGCPCDSGGTVFVRVSTGFTMAYIGKELTPA